MDTVHRPVMVEEVVEALRPRSGGLYVDATVGAGGHAAAILEASAPGGRLVGLDRDPDARALARERLAPFGERARVVEGNFEALAERAGLAPASVDGILADLGVSSLQLDRPERGFSFRRSGPLDMRMDPAVGPTAAEQLDRASVEELEGWLRRAGEERFAKILARRLKEAAPTLRTTEDLARAVSRWVPRRGPRHPATRVFLALRLAVNREIESLEGLLAEAARVLKPGGRLAVLTYHSTEDRRIKQAGRDRLLWRTGMGKPRSPGRSERAENPRSRSAKLRVLERL